MYFAFPMFLCRMNYYFRGKHMNQKTFFQNLDEVMELPAGTIQGNEELVALGKWDSMAILNFIALADEQFGIAVEPEALGTCVTVADLTGLMGDKVH